MLKSYLSQFTCFALVLLFLACSKKNTETTGEEQIPETAIPSTNAAYTIAIDAAKKEGTVSKYLMGFNSIYSFEKDALWQNGTGKIPSLLKRFNTGMIRYPGGAVVNRYHWNHLNGQGWKDNWSPTYNTADDLPATEFMDVDEYIKNTTAINAEPMLGINMGSGLKYDRVQDGIAEAVALVQYCKDNNYAVTYFYLDNEAYHDGANYKMTPAEYAEQINLYVPALKAVNPAIQIVINWTRNITSNNGQLKTIVANAGANIDIIEVHWYWSWNDASFENWISSFPMDTKNEWYNGFSFEKEIKAFAPLLNSLGHNHIQLASNEWNVAPSPTEEKTPTKFETALMVSEMFSQFVDANLFMANFWGVHWPNATGNAVNRLVFDPTDNYSENAIAHVFEMFGEALEKTKINCVSNLNGVYDIAVLDESTNELIVYLINKKQTNSTLSTAITLKNYSIESLVATSFVKGENGNGQLIELTASIDNKTSIRFDLPKNSLTKIVLNKQNP